MLTIDNLSFAYPSSPPLFSGLDARVERGEVLAIIGRNGAGKSTLLRLLNGLLRPANGDVRIGGASLSRMKIHQIARLAGTVYQSPEQQLFASTVEEEVAFGPKQFRFSKAHTDANLADALERTGLAAFARHHPLDLDYASRRFLTLACVLATEPDVILLDEPQRGLDRLWSERLEAIIAHEKHAGRAIVIICHDMDFVDRNADSILPLGGQSSWQAKTAEFFADASLVKNTGVERPWRLVVQDILAEKNMKDESERPRHRAESA